jgi:hypothetical protein
MLRVEALQIGGGKSRERRSSADLFFKVRGFSLVWVRQQKSRRPKE